MERLYLNLDGADRFLSKLKEIFSAKSHKHTKSDITDLPSTIGTVTGVKMNGASKGTSGVVDLGTVLTGGTQTTTSSADGGSNVYTFSDGSTLTIKNGTKGSSGANGTNGTNGVSCTHSWNGTTLTITSASGTSSADLKGASGSNGTNGTSAAWFSGTVVTGTSTTATTFSVSGSKAGDMYLNTSTANVYRASAANSWVYVCNIKGASGTNGTTPTIKAASGSNIDVVGTPSVTATTSGTTTTFTFNNLKGEKGDAGTNATTTAVATTSANGLMSSTDKSKLDGIATGANKTVVDTALSSTSTNPVQNKVVNAAISGKANSSHTHGNSDITAIDASKITSGTISIDRLPQGALERLTVVADDTARFKLTSSDVQKGDTVKVTGTGKMYYVVDESNLSSESGYEVYAAGTAASVPWSGVTGKPSTYTPSSHTHTKSQITDFPTIPTVNNPTITITQAGATKGTFTLNQSGNTTIALTDNNTTYSAATTSANGLMSSTDKSKLDGIASGATAVTDSTVSGWGYKKTDTNTWIALKGATTSAAGTAGYAPAPSAGAANRYLRSDGTWSVPPDTNTTYGVATTSANGLMSSTDKSKLDGIATGANAYTHPTTSGNKHIPSGGSSGQILRWSADGTAVWGADNNTTYSAVTTSANGLMTAADKKLLDIRNNPVGTCATGRATAAKVVTLANFVLTVGTVIAVKFTDTAGTANPTSGNLTLNVNNTGAKNIGYYRNGSKGAFSYGYGAYFYNNATHIFSYDGTYWLCMDFNVDNNTTYSVATTSVNGLMSSTDKSKLDGIATGANNYSLPTASSSTLGGVKTTSTVTSNSGYTACPIISGVPYYKDTNTVYSLPTATSSVLGGVKTGSNITNTSGTISLTKANVTSALGYTPPTTNTTYSVATTSANGLMSSTDKSKIDRCVREVYSTTEPTGLSANDHWLCEY